MRRVRITSWSRHLLPWTGRALGEAVPLADGAVEPIVGPEYGTCFRRIRPPGNMNPPIPMAKSEPSETGTTSKSNEKYLKRSRRYAKNNA
jgi:hypothetical protein